jgi:hypothetical protein
MLRSQGRTGIETGSEYSVSSPAVCTVIPFQPLGAVALCPHAATNLTTKLWQFSTTQHVYVIV